MVPRISIFSLVNGYFGHTSDLVVSSPLPPPFPPPSLIYIPQEVDILGRTFCYTAEQRGRPGRMCWDWAKSKNRSIVFTWHRGISRSVSPITYPLQRRAFVRCITLAARIAIRQIQMGTFSVFTRPARSRPIQGRKCFSGRRGRFFW